MDKVMGGTPVSGRTLCINCRMAQVIRGMNLQEVVFCHAPRSTPYKVPFPVTDCSLFDDKRIAALHQMESIAWNVTSRNRGPVGFTEERASEIHIEPPEHPGAPTQPAQWP